MTQKAVATQSLPHALLRGLVADAVDMVTTGFADAGDVDTAMRLGAGHPQGPIELLAASPELRAAWALDDAHLPARGDHPQTSPSSPAPWTSHVAVVGAGTMATGIVEVLASQVDEVTVLTRSPESGARLGAGLRRSVERSVRKGRRDERAAVELLGRVTTTCADADLGSAQLVVEAVAERLAVKTEVLARLDAVLPPQVVLATNTSSFRVGELASCLSPGRAALGLHFFNPAPAMPLVEVIVPPTAPDRLVGEGMAWARALGKTAIRCGDARGFVVNRLLIPFLNDAAGAVREDTGAADVDRMVHEELGHPMGPLALIDLIGVDITIAALESMNEFQDNPRLQPAPQLYRLVERGWLGRKSGRGFYSYEAPDLKEAR